MFNSCISYFFSLSLCLELCCSAHFYWFIYELANEMLVKLYFLISEYTRIQQNGVSVAAFVIIIIKPKTKKI